VNSNSPWCALSLIYVCLTRDHFARLEEKGGPFMSPRLDLTVPHHPTVIDQFNRRAEDAQLRIADQITRFAGSMQFVYLHIALFTVWMLFIESKPWPTLTLIVSLEAIFLSTFVMIGQNRQATFQQEKADHDFVAQEQELKTNTDLTREVHQMTQEIHAVVTAQPTQRS
jgi:uncharacterized membrane protein